MLRMTTITEFGCICQQNRWSCSWRTMEKKEEKEMFKWNPK